MKIRIFSIGKATISLKADQAEHDELVRLREENKFLKSVIADKDDALSESRKVVNHLLEREQTDLFLIKPRNN